MSATVLIVGYRAYDELARCLQSIARFEPDAAVVVVDHDADEARGRRVAAPFPSVRYVPRRENPGFAAGVNRAAQEARAGHLLLINPDCELRAPVIGPLVAVLDAHPEAGIVGGLVREADGAWQPSARRFPDWSTAFGGRTGWLTRLAPGNPLTQRNLTAPPEAGLVRADWVIGAFMLVRRETFDALRGFDEGFFLYWEDADFCRRAAARGWTTLYTSAAEVVHFTARTSRHAAVRSLWAFHASGLRYYWRHASWTARCLAPLVALGLLGRFLLRVPRSIAHRP
jgi:GT2 family glycosyltransferase